MVIELYQKRKLMILLLMDSCLIPMANRCKISGFLKCLKALKSSRRIILT